MCSIYRCHEWNKQHIIANDKVIDIVMPTHDFIEYSNNYLQTSGSLWQYYRDEPSLDYNGNIAEFTLVNYKSKLFKYKKMTMASDNDRKNIEMKVPLKYLSSFCRTLEVSLINCVTVF